MRHIRSVLLIVLAAGALSACGEKEKEPAPGQRAVAAEILAPSVSDDMLPYDTVSSQPPLAEPEKTDDAADGESSGRAVSGAEAETPAETAQPAASESSTTPDAE